MNQLTNNVITANIGADSRQFVHLIDGSWISPGAGPAAAAFVTGSRVKYTNLDCTPNIQPQTRGWNNAGMSIRIHNPNGDDQIFNQWSFTKLGSEATCVSMRGFRLEKWNFPKGVTITLSYDDGSGSRGVPELVSVSNNLGRKIHFISSGDGGFDNSLTGNDFRQVTVAKGATDASGSVTQTGTNWDTYKFNARLVGGRYLLDQIYYPQTPNVPFLRYNYDTLERVVWGFDAESLQVGDRGAWSFRIANGIRGVRTDPAGGRYEVMYDTYGMPFRYIDEVGRTTTAQYDGRGRVTEYDYPAGGKQIFGYDARNNTTDMWRISRPGSGMGQTYVHVDWHGSFAKPTRVVDANGNVTDLTYDGATGLLTSLTGASVTDVTNGITARPVTSFQYDGLGRMTRTQNPTGMLTDFAYDGSNGSPTQETVDAGGQKITSNFGYDAQGQATTVADPRGYTATTTYDANGRPTSIDLPEGARTEWSYNVNGWVLYERQAKDAAHTQWSTVTTSYTATGQKATVTDPAGQVTSYAYDGADRLVRTTDPLGRVSVTDYDAAGQKLRERRAVGTPLEQISASYTYDPDGLVATITDPRNNVLSYVYDGFGRVASLRYPDGASDSYGYDANDNVLTTTQRDGSTSLMTYDAANRVSTIARPGLATVGLGYDLLGRLRRQVLGSGNTPSRTLTYDGANHLVGATTYVPRPNMTDASFSMVFGYDAAGNRTSVTWPDGAVVTWAYDGLARVTDVTEGSFTWAHYTYDTLSRKTNTVRGPTAGPAVSSSAYTYDGAGRLATLGNGWIGGAVNYTYGYDLAGQVVSTGLDNDAFLSTAGTTQSYGTANPINGYASVNGVGYGYDRRGNLTSVSGSATMAYDSRNMLTQFQQGATVQTMGYYSEGGRAWKRVNGVLTLTFEALGVEWGDYDANGGLLRRYVRSTGAGGPGGGDVVGWVDGGGNRSLAVHDRQGSVIAVLNASGQATSTYAYNEFGQSAQDGSTGSPYRYAGMRYDEIGLYVTPNRTYVPGIGRWLQMDPAGIGDGLNRYAYVHNDPLGNVDVSGLEAGTLFKREFDLGGSKAHWDQQDSRYAGQFFNHLAGYLPGASFGRQAGASFAAGNYGTGALQLGAGFVDAAVAIGTFGEASLAEGAAGKVGAGVAATEAAPEAIQLSKARFGHTFERHGQNATDFLSKRAAGSGLPQGQFLDDQAAGRLIQDNLGKLGNGPVSVPVPEGFPARVIMPDGSFATPNSIRLVPSGAGVKTAYPEL